MSDFIPGEIQVQILKLLPVKNLLRLRCVYKWWKKLIDSPSFVQDHLAVQKPQLIIEYGEPEFVVLDPLTLPLFETLCGPIEDDPKKYHLAGTLHGIVCLHDNHTSIYLWNPSIRKLSSLPLPKLYDVMYFRWKTDPNYGGGGWTTYSAFWIDPSNKHFKIMLFVLEMYETINRYGAIYSSIKGDWKKMPLGEVGNHNSLPERAATVIGGVAYWTASDPVTDEEGEIGADKDVVVLSFDFGLERFDIIPAPSVTYHSWFDPVVCKLQDTLSFVYFDFRNGNRCDIYLRQEGSWLHTFCFNITPCIWHVLWVLGETDERDKGLVQQMQPNCSRILSTIGGELVLLDTKGGCISLKSGLPDSVDIFPAYDFVESLLFP